MRVDPGPYLEELLARQDVGQEGRPTYWYVTDKQGSVIRMLKDGDAQALTTAQMRLFVNGSRTGERDPTFRDDFDHTGRELYSVGYLELQYNRARFYSPELSRWLSEDPIGCRGGDTNLYRYVGNSHPTLPTLPGSSPSSAL